VKAFGGVREVFETLTARGGKIALATECKGPELRHYLSLLAVCSSADETPRRDAECLFEPVRRAG
jgi:hypothetical protein